jgi:phosphatidate cytidylyltransferase
VLVQRLIYGSLLAGLLLLLVWIDGALSARVRDPGRTGAVPVMAWLGNGAIITGIVLVFSLLATRELLRFARATGHSRPFPIVAYVFSTALVIGPFLNFNLRATGEWSDESWGMMWLAIALGTGFVLQGVWRRSQHAMVNLATTIFIIFYAGGLAGYMTKLRMEIGGWHGMIVVVFSMFLVKMTDVGAYFVGRLTGRHKLIEWLSPRKTWEGVIGGYVVALACALAVGTPLYACDMFALGNRWLAYPWGLVVLALTMATAGIAGDLFASLLKRDAAMKDSGSSLPGMGGVLDVLDSVLLAAPAAWFFWTRLIVYDH